MEIFFIGVFCGVSIGVIIMSCLAVNKIATLEGESDTLQSAVRNRDKFIEKQMEVNTNLNNNLRLVTNSLSSEIKEAINLDTDNF